MGDRPVPLPRTKFTNHDSDLNHAEEDSTSSDSSSKKRFGSGRNFIRRDWKTASDIFQEKGKIVLEASRNEVQKLEKSIKNTLSRRKTVHPKLAPETLPKDYGRSLSLPNQEFFNSISFGSPLVDGDRRTVSSDEDSFYSTHTLPPPYPPPDLPDESSYDETSGTSSDGPAESSYVASIASSDSNSIYEDISKYTTSKVRASVILSALYPKSESEKSFSSKDVGSSCESWQFYDPVQNDGSKYENVEIESTCGSEYLSTMSSIDTSEQNFDLSVFGDDSTPVMRLDKSGTSLPSQSVILEFDPLFEQLDSVSLDQSDGDNEPKIEPIDISKHFDLKELSRYSRLPDEACASLGIKFPSPLVPPPIPPRRFDSISPNTTSEQSLESPETCGSTTSLDKIKKSSQAWTSIKDAVKRVTENRGSWSPSAGLARKPSKKATKMESVTENVTSEFFIQNSESSEVLNTPKFSLNHSGVLYRPGGVRRWGQLLQRKLTIFADKDSRDVKDAITLDKFLSLQLLVDHKISVDGKPVDCFELSVSNKNQPHLFGTPTPYDRYVWMQKLLESVILSFPTKLSSDYTRAGWCFMKEGVGGEWNTTSILLRRRCLYLSPRNAGLQQADLRKARCLKLQKSDSSYNKAAEHGPIILIDLPEKSLYLQMNYIRETIAWEQVITNAAFGNGPRLCDQQLTKDNVPVIVEKCVNFVYTHGSLSEGIYRKSGSSSVVNRLLTKFRSNAWAVELLRNEYSEYDVASGLKRFFRDLPESLMTTSLRPPLCDVAETLTLSEDEKVTAYKELFSKLPEINFATLRRLIGHLYFIHQQRDKNLMPVENLSSMWGPTLMHVEEGCTLDANWANRESNVINDLIVLYPKLFDVCISELEREKTMLNVLEKYNNSLSSPLPVKPSGDLRVWVYLHSKTNAQCVNVTLTPHKLASDVCEELSTKMKIPAYELCLEERISNEMYRPMHYTEKPLYTVLRWSYWDESDRKDNILICKQHTLLKDLAPMLKPPLVVCEELRFADKRSKHFKNVLFEFSKAKLKLYKDKTCSTIIREWKIEDIVWYSGHEAKRNPQTRWAITFIEQKISHSRSKDEPYFGYTICGTTKEQQLKWIAAMLLGQYPQGVLQSPVLLE